MNFEQINTTSEPEVNKELVDGQLNKLEDNLALAETELKSIGGEDGLQQSVDELSEGQQKNILDGLKRLIQKVEDNALELGLLALLPVLSGVMAEAITGDLNIVAVTAGLMAALETVALAMNNFKLKDQHN